MRELSAYWMKWESRPERTNSSWLTFFVYIVERIQSQSLKALEGTKIYIFMKKISYLLVVLCLVACNDNQPNNPTDETSNPSDFVDLGLPSGTKWQKGNENTGITNSVVYFHYSDAISQFGSSVPTVQQWKELTEKCNWIWTKKCQEAIIGKDTIMLSGYKVFGPSGDSIMLPATGCCSCSGDTCYLDSYGIYMSSTPYNPDGVNGFSLKKDSVYIGYYLYCDGLSVRRVMNP